jgi:hypothetical protein
MFTQLLRTHTAYVCVIVTSWWMMKPSQNGVLLLQLHPYLQKSAKCESGKYRPVSWLGAYFLSLWIFRDRRGINPLNSINVLAWEQFRSGKRLLEVTILYNWMHEILWTLNNETYCSALFCDLVRHLWLEIMTVLFDKQGGLCSACTTTMQNKEQIFCLWIHTVTKTEAL